MIRFVDLTSAYWCGDSDSPCCAFLSTVTDRFVEVDGCEVFHGPEDLEALEDKAFAKRLKALVPEGFWKAGAVIEEDGT